MSTTDEQWAWARYCDKNGDLINVIGHLRSLLSDLHYERGDLNEHLSKKGFCLECYSNSCRCECHDDTQYLSPSIFNESKA
jgi:hypothetical protein